MTEVTSGSLDARDAPVVAILALPLTWLAAFAPCVLLGLAIGRLFRQRAHRFKSQIELPVAMVRRLPQSVAR
jgi:hypothetical protein